MFKVWNVCAKFLFLKQKETVKKKKKQKNPQSSAENNNFISLLKMNLQSVYGFDKDGGHL